MHQSFSQLQESNRIPIWKVPSSWQTIDSGYAVAALSTTLILVRGLPVRCRAVLPQKSFNIVVLNEINGDLVCLCRLLGHHVEEFFRKLNGCFHLGGYSSGR